MIYKSRHSYIVIAVSIFIIMVAFLIKIIFDMNIDLKKDIYPDVRNKIIAFINTGISDPGDPISKLCYLNIEIKNYGNALAKNIDLEKIIIHSPSRGTIEYNNYIDSEKLPLYLDINMSIAFKVGFVLNPLEELKKYDEGKEPLTVEMHMKYKDTSNRQFSYYSKWEYIKKEFYLIDTRRSE